MAAAHESDAHESDAMQFDEASIDEASIDEASFKFESLPSELRLCCCEFLDAGSLARLETCARESLIDSKRAWKQLVAGSSRGALINCSDKHLAVVTAGVRALFPRSMDVPDEPLPPRPRYEVGDFLFTWVVYWQGETGFQTAAFEHLACHTSWDREKPQAIAELNVSEYVFNVPADAHKAHAAISPFLKSSQDGVDTDEDDDEDVVNAFFNNWRPSAVLICTRKHDGKSIKLAHFEDLDRDDGINTLVNEDNLGSLCFNIASLRLPHDVAEHFEEITQSVILVFRKDTGHLRYIFSSFHDADVSPVTSDFINMLLHDTMRHYDDA